MDEAAAKAFGLFEGQLVVLIHTGSRGLGHQVATDYIRTMQTAMPNYDFKLPDRELACVPFNSPEGTDYYHAMCAAANYAWCNRQLVSWEVRKAWENILGKDTGPLHLLYDIAHNIAKIEEYDIEGQRQKVIVHRKGATRAFGPGFEELPEAFRPHGQPVMIPGTWAPVRMCWPEAKKVKNIPSAPAATAPAAACRAVPSNASSMPRNSNGNCANRAFLWKPAPTGA